MFNTRRLAATIACFFHGISPAQDEKRLFPTNPPRVEWQQFAARGFSQPACGVIYRTKDRVDNGMALGGVDTGCLDLETSGLLGYCTIFNTHVPRRGPINLPILGLSVGGKTWVLCQPKPKLGQGEYQYGGGRTYRLWRDKGWVNDTQPILTEQTELKLEGVETVKEIHYWGHYPVADLEFETSAPVEIGMRIWSPFLPGDVVASMLPGIVLEVHLRNAGGSEQQGTLVFSFPGPTDKEAGTNRFNRKECDGAFTGAEIAAPKASYAMGVIGKEKLRLGGELGADGGAWCKIAAELPPIEPNKAGSSAGVDFGLGAGETKTVRFLLAWHAADWNAGGYNWAGAPHTFTHMYARHYTGAAQAAETLARNHENLLRRILAWQQVIYTEQRLPVWLRDSLVNILHLITEDGMWAQKKDPLPGWVREQDGLFGLNECPRGCPQIECIPCSFYGNQPLVYFFPELALSTLRGYKGYQYPDGAPVWVFGGCTGNTPPVDFANPTRGYQFASNGISLAAMVDRYRLCHGERHQDFVKEFWPIIKQNTVWTIHLRKSPSYSIGEKIIAMPRAEDTDELAKPPTEWFEAPQPGWFGMTAHIGGLHLAQLRIVERLAKDAGDDDFARQCAEWIEAGADSMEKRLWTGSYYLNFVDPDTGRKSDLVFGYQLDGEWITDHHGLAGALPAERIVTVLETIKRCNIAVTQYGAVNYANPNATPAKVGGYGTYSYFPPEALMLAMTYMYNGRKEFGLELAHKVWHNITCIQGYTWDQPNIMRGDTDTGERTYGNDYYQNMMLWSLPAAVEGKDFAGPIKTNGLVDRILKASLGKDRPIGR